jgi:hypothetical protein
MNCILYFEIVEMLGTAIWASGLAKQVGCKHKLDFKDFGFISPNT